LSSEKNLSFSSEVAETLGVECAIILNQYNENLLEDISSLDNLIKSTKKNVSFLDEEKIKDSINTLIKYQLIEEKLIIENDIKINSESIKEFATNMIKNQMAAYGQNNPDDKELNSILTRILSNQDEVKRISNQIISEKLLVIYKEKVNIKNKSVSYEEYIEIAYKKNN